MFSEEVDDKNISASNGRYLEFSIGLSLVHAYDFAANEHVRPSDFMSNQSIFVGIPVSLVFYPNNIFGIGFIYEISSGTILLNGYVLYGILLSNSMRIVNKAGNLKKGNWLLLEYGACFLSNFNIADRYYASKFYRQNRSVGIQDEYLIGPDIFLGYEKLFRNKFEFDVGLFYNALYRFLIIENSKNKIYYYPQDYQYWQFDLGIEIRCKISLGRYL
jgi:hypothetical protein